MAKNEVRPEELNPKQTNILPVAIIGAGPVGLAAAAHLAKRGESFILIEAGSHAGANILKWEHVRLFSPWKYNVDKTAADLLKQQGWSSPELDALPTGKELVEYYLDPLSKIKEIKPHLVLNTKVLSISRKDIDKMKNANRDRVPFILYTEADGDLQKIEARAVIDATGTWGNPNPAHSNGVWLKDEKNLQEQIYYGIPDVLGKEKKRYANKRLAVVGSGHSAMNALLELVKLTDQYPQTEILWIMRRNQVEDAYGGEEKDALAARGELGSRVHNLVDKGKLTVYTPYRIQSLVKKSDTIAIKGNYNGEETIIPEVQEIIVNTGSRPDFEMLREVRTSIDTATESVEALAPLIDPNIHSCGTVRPHGEKELRQPEKDFYIVGAKSYGRAPTFLMATGYEQVRSVVAHLVADYEAARKVELDLPETGVCNVNLNLKDPSIVANSCC
nr:FAD-dependent oxidoreductase [Metabacillus arenae]